MANSTNMQSVAVEQRLQQISSTGNYSAPFSFLKPIFEKSNVCLFNGC